jgi:hypothetical protein
MVHLEKYERLIGDALLSITAFGKTFLMIVALTYFNDEKEID